MNRKGFMPIIVAIIIAVILVAGGAYWYVHRSTQKQSIQTIASSTTHIEDNSSTSEALINSTTTSARVLASSTVVQIASSVVETPPTLSLDSVLGVFDGYSLVYGTNTIEGITFNVLPLYSIGQTYNNRCQGDCDQDPFQIWSRYGNYKFIANYPAGWGRSALDIYTGSDTALDQIGSIDIGSPEYGYPTLQTFSYNGRDYFVVGSTMNAGTGGADDLHILFSDVDGSSTQTFNLWDNGWSWGGGYMGSTESPSGDEYGGRLNFVIAYNEHIFLFPKTQPVVEVDKNGNMLAHLDQTTSTAANILTYTGTD